MKRLLVCFAFIVTALTFNESARADTPISKCWTWGRVCTGPSVALTVFDYNLSTRAISAASFSTGYAASFYDGLFGLGFYLNAEIGNKSINHIDPAILASIFQYIHGGIKVYVGEDKTAVSVIGAIGTQF